MPDFAAAMDRFKEGAKNLSAADWAKIAGGLAVFGAFLYMTAPAEKESAKIARKRGTKVTSKELVPVYKELCSEFHVLLVDLAFSINRVHTKMKLQGLEEKVTLKEIAHVVVQQWPTSKLLEVQNKILKKYEFGHIDELDTLAMEFISDPELKMYAEGMQEMQHVALQGEIPTMPGIEKLPEFLNEDGCLSAIAKMNDAKLTRIQDIFSSNPPPMNEVADMLRNVSWDVERSILDEYKKSGEFGGHCEFYNALGKFLKDQAFVKRKEVLDVQFQAKMTDVLKSDIEKQKAKAAAVASGENIQEVDDVN